MHISIKSAICASISALMCFLSSAGIYTGQINSIQSVKKLDEGFYVMDYTYDYDIDEMLSRGINTHVGLFVQAAGNILGDACNFGCTTFNSVTKGGDYLFSRNFDYMDADYMLVWTHPSDGYASISSVSLDFCGYIGSMSPDDSELAATLTLLAPYSPLDGINEKGLSIGVLELETDPVFQISKKPNLTTTTMIRACLDKAATVDEAIAIFESHDMRDYLFGECTYHYQIADAKENTCVIEYIDGKINILYPEKTEGNKVDYMAAANFYLTEGVDDPLAMGHDRYETAMNALKKSKGIAGESKAMDILESCSMKDADLHGYICSTLWSTVFNMTDKTVTVCHHNNYDKVYKFSIDNPCVNLNK